MDTVSIIMPTYNEEKYIRESLEAILAQDFPREQTEIIIVDGMSLDKTREIINEYIEKNEHIRLLDNPQKTVNHALNMGIKASESEYIVRVDAHSKIESNYVSVCVSTHKTIGAFNVGGPTRFEGKTKVQKIIAAAYSSKFALGGSNHYEEIYEGYANTVSWGTFKREDLIKLGMYDENLPRSEDEDLNCRIADAGGKIYITPKAKYIVYPTESYSALFEKYYNYGLWKPVVIKKHRRLQKIKYYIPAIFVAYTTLYLLFSLFLPFKPLFNFVIFVYIIMNCCFSFTNKKLTKFENGLGLMWAHFVIHAGYGLGFLKKLADFAIGGK